MFFFGQGDGGSKFSVTIGNLPFPGLVSVEVVSLLVAAFPLCGLCELSVSFIRR